MKAKAKVPYRHILVPLDGSKLAEAALKEALLLAKSARARVTFLQAVWPIIDVMNTGTQVATVERIRKREAVQEKLSESFSSVSVAKMAKTLFTRHGDGKFKLAERL
jgi:nucleotide-binding universal stress UspA family protein